MPVQVAGGIPGSAARPDGPRCQHDGPRRRKSPGPVRRSINKLFSLYFNLFIRGGRRLLRAIAVGARGQQGFYGLRPARVARSPQRRRRRAAASSAEPPSAELKRRHPWASRLVPPRASCVCPRIPALLVDAGLPSQHLAPARAGACRLGAFLRPRPHVKGPRFCAPACPRPPRRRSAALAAPCSDTRPRLPRVSAAAETVARQKFQYLCASASPAFSSTWRRRSSGSPLSYCSTRRRRVA